jgi:hypothetical protein
MLVFSTGFVNYCPYNLLSGYLPPPPCVSKYTRTVPVYREGSLRTDKIPAAKNLYRSIFLGDDIWHYILTFYQSNLSTLFPIEGGADLLFLVDVVDLGVGGLIVERQLVASREFLERGMTLRSFHPVFRIDILKGA